MNDEYKNRAVEAMKRFYERYPGRAKRAEKLNKCQVQGGFSAKSLFSSEKQAKPLDEISAGQLWD